MISEEQNPVDLFDLHISHVGINATNQKEAQQIADRLTALMGLGAQTITPVSIYAGTVFEVMNGNGRGTNGHVGFYVNDMPAAEKWFAARGFEVDETSRRLNPDGSTHLVYFKEQVADFALHLTCDK